MMYDVEYKDIAAGDKDFSSTETATSVVADRKNSHGSQIEKSDTLTKMKQNSAQFPTCFLGHSES